MVQAADGDVPRLLAELRDHITRKTGKPLDPHAAFLTAQIEILSDSGPATVNLHEGLHLSPKERRLLNHLLSRPGHVFSREALMNALYFNRAGDWPEPRIVDIFIFHIRAALKARKSAMGVETILGVGWRVVGV